MNARLRGIVVALAATLCLAVPAAASVRVNIEDKDVVPDPAGGKITLDVVFEGTDARNEMLIAYDLGFRLDTVVGRLGDVRFAPPYAEEPADHFVLAGWPTETSLEVSAPPGDGFIFSVLADVMEGQNTRLPDVVGDTMKAARVLLEYGPGAATPGEYHVRLLRNRTTLASGDPGNASPDILTDITDVGVVRLVPEPAALAVTAIPFAAWLLRGRPRRRTISGGANFC